MNNKDLERIKDIDQVFELIIDPVNTELGIELCISQKMSHDMIIKLQGFCMEYFKTVCERSSHALSSHVIHNYSEEREESFDPSFEIGHVVTYPSMQVSYSIEYRDWKEYRDYIELLRDKVELMIKVVDILKQRTWEK